MTRSTTKDTSVLILVLRPKGWLAEGEVITSSYSLRRGEYELVITEAEATNCFSINFQVNMVRLSRKFVFICTLHRCLHYGVNMNFASDEASFCKI